MIIPHHDEKQRLASTREYEDSSFESRLDDGLSIDRSIENGFASVTIDLFKAKSKKDPRILLEDSMQDLMYRNSRKMNPWHTKRLVNSKIVHSTLIHDHLIELSRPILLDLFLPVQPTAKEWKDLSKITTDNMTDNDVIQPKMHEKSVRRMEEYYPHIVGKFTGHTFILKNADGSLDKYPKWPERKDESEENATLKSIATHYSLPPQRGMLDMRDFVDVNYLIRLKKYWRSMTSLLAELLEKGPIRKEMSWLVYHIVNNDFGLYMLFDNLSLECEVRWFRRLGIETKTQIIGVPGIESEPYFFTEIDAKKGVAELQKFIQEFENFQMPTTLLKYKISSKMMKKRIHDLGLAAIKTYDFFEDYQQAGFVTDAILKYGL